MRRPVVRAAADNSARKVAHAEREIEVARSEGGDCLLFMQPKDHADCAPLLIDPVMVINARATEIYRLTLSYIRVY